TGGRDTEIVIGWVPSHVGIEENERADKLAKTATIGNNIKLNIEILPTCEETKTVLRNEILINWNHRWNNQFPSKLHQIIQNVKQKSPALLFDR
ncbi:hypothetical protein HHI36_015213, partial [Cryptolaemus montrouzieri]